MSVSHNCMLSQYTRSLLTPGTPRDNHWDAAEWSKTLRSFRGFPTQSKSLITNSKDF
jgi:hypothetical protein